MLEEAKSLYERLTPSSKKLWMEALEAIPGGVTANIKYYDPYPIFARKAYGSKLYDVDGNEYIDYCLCYGALVLGHGHPDVVSAIEKQLKDGGTSIFGTPHELEVLMARKIKQHIPCAEMVRFTNSGLEATLHALRIARAYTRRGRIAKFEGHYHGAHDYVLISVSPLLSEIGSPEKPKPAPSTAGLPDNVIKETVVLPFNDLDATLKILRGSVNDLAAVILEPVARGFLPADREFLKGLREFTEENGVMLVFDEVMTGLRLGLGGAQEYYGVIPDLTALGKAWGGGLPFGAFVGKREVMELASPLSATHDSGKLFHSGTYNGCPIVLAAGLATVEALERGEGCQRMIQTAERLKEGMAELFDSYNVDAQVVGVGSMFQPVFTRSIIKNYRDVAKANTKRRITFDLELVCRGVYVRPGRTFYTSLAHNNDDVDKSLKAVEEAARRIRR